MPTELLPARQAEARAWFEKLRDDICAAFERVEDAQEVRPSG